MAKAKTDDGSLKRLGGGRWLTRDERFTIEPQSGTWMVVDAQQTDDLGLALVRGPFGSLAAAKDAIAAARQAPPVVSPKAALVAQLRDRPVPVAKAAVKPVARAPKPVVRRPQPPPEPRWFRDLAPAEKRRARELIERLSKAGARDPEAIARRDIVDGVPAAAAFAVARAIAALGMKAVPGDVARRLVDGRDPEIGVRWRLVDGDGRQITLDLSVDGGREP
jgi:hypothetical protein